VSNIEAITVYPLGASGNTAPVRTITGALTQLAEPAGLAIDKDDNLYVANESGTGVTVYPAIANGNVAPTATLMGTDMLIPTGVVIGSAGDIFVSTCGSCGETPNASTSGVFHFPSLSAASDYNISGANPQLIFPVGLALDPSGGVWVANMNTNTVQLFAAGSMGNATPTVLMNLGESTVEGVAVADGTVFVTIYQTGVDLFPPSASGEVTPTSTLTSASVIFEDPEGIFVDTSTPSPTVYVADQGTSAVYIFQTMGTAPDLTVASVTTLSGAATGINGPMGILVVH
jgi:sugar lactone lactonase YvrE